ncbi:substrate binding domain-containing protein [Massilia glaciei]|uniref:LysR substrate-binding domain-containing protein n=1 Tax=Massilia glaciei TaxID=1524097 RepID=A0A2U2HK70_9BURK|nr:substrate binding domain-containing protein [Massilia glaciei]PWF47826.1 hypothetical protein C7C56_013780 [Massilia glaciei]
MPKITRAYLQQYPGTSVELLLSNSVTDLVGEGIDLAIRAGRLKDSTLIAKRFFALKTNLWASPSYLKDAGAVRHPRDLAKHRLLGLSVLKTMTMTDGKTEEQIPVASRVVTDDFETIRAMLLLGEGIGWLPDFLGADPAATGTLVSVLPKWTTKTVGDFHFVYPGKKYASPKVQSFIRIALDLVNAR